MIDLEKEREAFEDAYQHHSFIKHVYRAGNHYSVMPNLNIAKDKKKIIVDLANSSWNAWQRCSLRAQEEITELKQKLEKLESDEWISVKDRRPQLSDCILQGEAFLAWDGREIRRVPFRMYRENSDITDWMPMPKPPKLTNLIDSFIADGGFDRVMGCKNGE